MSESAYLLVFGDNSDAFFRFFGIDEAYRAERPSLYTLDTRIRNLAEVAAGEPLGLTLQLLDLDAKRLHILHRMRHGARARKLAVAEQVLAHVDMRAQARDAVSARTLRRLAAIRAAHARSRRRTRWSARPLASRGRERRRHEFPHFRRTAHARRQRARVRRKRALPARRSRRAPRRRTGGNRARNPGQGDSRRLLCGEHAGRAWRRRARRLEFRAHGARARPRRLRPADVRRAALEHSAWAAGANRSNAISSPPSGASATIAWR